MAQQAPAARLRVAIGVLCGVTGGPATYGRRLVAALGAHDDLEITVLTDQPDRLDGAPGARARVVALPMRGGVDRLRWQHLALPRALARLRCDVYHDTKNALPAGWRGAAVVTVHDLACYRVPESFGTWSRLFLRHATKGAVRRAARVIVPSQATAGDVAALYPRDAHKTRVVPHGIDPARRCADGEVARVLAKHRLAPPYVLHVGTIQPRKNIDLLVRAVRELRRGGLPHRLALAGRRGWLAAATCAELERDDTAVLLGEVPPQDLPALYAGADAFCSPSAYEGFGLAVADALAAGVPVVIADRSSLPEVCGDACVRVAELTVEAVTAALRALLLDQGERQRLAGAGPVRAAAFSWARAAAQHADVYREAAAATSMR